MPLLYSGAQWAVLIAVLLFGILLKASVVAWLHRDVQRAGRRPWPWTITGVFLSIPTLLVWRVRRPPPAPVRRAAPTVSRPRPEVPERPADLPRRREDAAAFRVGQYTSAAPPREQEPPGPADAPDVRAAPAAAATPVTCMACGSRYRPLGDGCPTCGARRRP